AQAERADADLSIQVPIGGVPLKVEGAANLPTKILAMNRLSLKQDAFVELGKGVPQVMLKRGLFARASKLEITIDFERGSPLESLEMARDRANEIGRDHVQQHRLSVTLDGKPIEEQSNGSTD
ncbi:MAG: hypothetical protein OXC11_03550, partial [Rhodospirillales bacterium]|nr:hypothetical protein [Rhodospirillales bacterium]